MYTCVAVSMFDLIFQIHLLVLLMSRATTAFDWCVKQQTLRSRVTTPSAEHRNMDETVAAKESCHDSFQFVVYYAHYSFVKFDSIEG